MKPYVNFTWETDQHLKLLKNKIKNVSCGVTSKLIAFTQAKNDLISPTLGYIDTGFTVNSMTKNVPIHMNSTYVQANISVHIFVNKTKILFVCFSIFYKKVLFQMFLLQNFMFNLMCFLPFLFLFVKFISNFWVKIVSMLNFFQCRLQKGLKLLQGELYVRVHYADLMKSKKATQFEIWQCKS